VKIAIVILAGGQGKRIGGDKPSRMLRGVRLLDRAVAYASSQAKLSAVAVREPRQAGDLEIPLVPDDAEIHGPLAGLVTALRFARDEGADAALTIAADMPFLPPDLADRLVEALPGTRAAIACSGGHQHPVCGLWRTEALDAVAEYLASGRRSLKGFAELVGYVAVEWPANPRDPFFNINSERDLAEAERLLS
jgi:molybdopterin-guanine dinucleotide biosynthesis protein A